MERELSLIFRQEENVLRYKIFVARCTCPAHVCSMQCSELVNAKEETNHPNRIGPLLSCRFCRQNEIQAFLEFVDLRERATGSTNDMRCVTARNRQ